MNDKISKQKMYTDFSIRLDKLEYKLDKLLALMGSKEIPIISAKPGHGPAFVEGLTYLEKVQFPPQWPNESYIDYMKRIGELNTAQSDEEAFREECK